MQTQLLAPEWVSMTESLDARFVRLSPRQRDCLRLIYDRKSTKDIAAILDLSPGTVSGYCAEAIQVIGARNRIDAAEQFEAYERKPAPFDQYPQSGGVVSEAVSRPTSSQEEVAPWRHWLPVRTRGAEGNETGIIARLVWITVFALVFAIGFGMLAVGVRATSDLVAGRTAEQ